MVKMMTKMKTMMIMTIIRKCAVVVFLLVNTTFAVNETWLLERYQAGDLDTIRYYMKSLPESSSVGHFFKGIFEQNGEAARLYFDRIVGTGSIAEAWALERLWQYHWSKGEVDKAKIYFGFLKQRHPNHPGLTNHPDFSSGSGLRELLFKPEVEKVNILKGRWRVQLGAFSRSEGARKVADKVKGFDKVDLIGKVVRGKRYTVVQIGHFHNRAEAEKLAGRIRASTGIKGLVMVVDG